MTFPSGGGAPISRAALLPLLASAGWVMPTPAFGAAEPAQEAPPAPPTPQVGAPPPGFENLDDAIDTQFDVVVLGRRIGSFRATLVNGQVTFQSPEAVADALTGIVDRDAVLSMLAHGLPTNEQLRCYPGQTIGCGLLAPGQQGLIANPERFSVELFFAPSSIVRESSRKLDLGPSSSSGPSLIQNVTGSVASTGFNTSSIEFGGTLDTLASIGSTSVVAQTLVGTSFGARVNQGIIQHVQGNRMIRGGLIEDYSTNLLANYRMLGAEYGSFYPQLAYEGDQQGTPLDVVLPRDADVEIRRNDVLLSARRYAAGPQRLDTSSLPNGSYPVRVIARVDGVVVMDEVRNYSRGGGLPISGKTEFSMRAGLFVEDRFSGTDTQQSGFLPGLRKAPVFGVHAARRVLAATALEANVLTLDGKVLGEATVRTFLSSLEGSATVAASSDGAYGATITGSAMVKGIRFNLSGRMVRTDDQFGPLNPAARGYRAFFRRENSIVASAQFRLLDGSMGLGANYSSTPGQRDRYVLTARYSRSVTAFGRPAFLSLYGSKADNESRVGAQLAFTFGVGAKTSASVSGGAEYVPVSAGATREGFSPSLAASLSRRDQLGSADLISRANASTGSDGERLGATAMLESSYGVADLTAQQVRNRSGNYTTLVGNAQTGFAIGGGAAKWGLARTGQAVILSDLEVDTPDGGGTRSDSGYRVRVDTQAYDLLRPGHRSAVGLSAFDEYEVSLSPENAPPYDVLIAPKRVTLYPGNVVRMRYSARRDVTLFGQLVDADGKPLADARMRGGSDFTVTNEQGYFTLTLQQDSKITVTPKTGKECTPFDVRGMIPGKSVREFHRVGQLVCK